MKKIMLLLIAVILGSFTFAQKVTEIKPSQLPKGVTDYISQNLPGVKIVRAGTLEDKGVLTYLVSTEIKGRKHAYQFDKDGKFIGKADHLYKARPQGISIQPAPGSKTNAAPATGTAPATKPPVKTK
ncbi:MAG: hypothetical protein PHF97_12640 [Bacteroidales bacterium]|nr:hypothetical protein [Bacteroidales bacterium]MDD4604633.1 hypothetical protein [Bacteroidales bacterium]